MINFDFSILSQPLRNYLTSLKISYQSFKTDNQTSYFLNIAAYSNTTFQSVLPKRLSFLLVSFLAMGLQAQEKPMAFKGALVYTVAGDPIENGVLVVHKGKIVSVG